MTPSSRFTQVRQRIGSGTFFATFIALAILLPISALADFGYLDDYDTGGLAFQEIEIGENLVVYFHQRELDGAVVEKDYIVYQFDRATGDLLDRKTHWREDLPEHFAPLLLNQTDAEAMVSGEIQFSRLYIISPESDVFPLDPARRGPCWVVHSIIDGNLELWIIDAIEGIYLGKGIPPPFVGISVTGPTEFNPCAGDWQPWSSNAQEWFGIWGYATDEVIWPTEDTIRGHIQSVETAVFYELAHGGSYSFAGGCLNGEDPEYTYYTEVELWINDYEKMPFTFLGSCDGMCHVSQMSAAFRKGSEENTATVGYCGMSGPACADCWIVSLAWQEALFAYISMGVPVKTAFDLANADFPACATAQCMRFAGDDSLTLVPPVPRVPWEYACCLEDDCVLLRQDECLAAGGDWLESHETCDPNPCPSRLYVCCIGEICQILTLSECTSAGGDWLMGEESCDPNPCLYEYACCIGETCQILTQQDCAAAGGEWQGGVTSCEPNPCLYVFACCVGNECQLMTLEDCTDAGGEWQEGAASCHPNPCPLREYACCLGAMCFIATLDDCSAASGSWQVGEGSCDPNPCIDAARLSGGSLIAHYCAELIYTSPPPPEGWGQHYLDHYAITSSAEQVTRIDFGPEASIWFVLSAWDSDKEFCSVQFGLGDYYAPAYTFVEYGPCFVESGLELPSSGWPGPIEGTAFVVSGLPWTGNYVPVYHFIGYAYEYEATIPLDVDPSVANPFGGFANCASPPEAYAAECFGAMGINVDGAACHPASQMRVCCVSHVCYLLTYSECMALGGEWHLEWTSCDPDPCGASDVTAPGGPIAPRLLAPAPNPFQQTTQLRFRLDSPRDVRLEIYDAGGRLLRRLLTGPQRAGTHAVEWDGRDANDLPVGPGSYFCRLTTAAGLWSQRVVVLE